MNLLLDLGNSRLKWKTSKDGDQGQSATYSALPHFTPDQFERILISSVRDASATKSVLARLGLLDHPKLRIASTRHSSFDCYYDRPEKLGVDRFLAALGAASYESKCVVVDAGTALTIDLVDNGFRGGVIMLGIGRSIQSLLSGTDLINEGMHASEGPLPTDTSAAVERGAWLQAVGAINEFRGHYAPGSSILVTGGDGEMLVASLEGASFHADLVLDGLAYAEYKELT